MAVALCLALVLTVAAASSDWNATLVAEGLRVISSKSVEQTTQPMTIEGEFPHWLHGRYYRNGPGQFKVDDSPGSQRVNALFDGYAITNMFQLDGAAQTATHSSKFVHSPRFNSLRSRGDMSYQGKIMLGTTPVRKESLNPMNLGGEMSVNFMRMGNSSTPQHLLAVGELPFGMEIDSATLETVPGSNRGAFFKYSDHQSELGMGCAHPVVLPNGDMITKTATVEILSMGSRTDYNILRIAAGSTERTVLATYTRTDLQITYAHSFAVASGAEYAILPFWALGVSKLGMLTHNDLIDGMKYDASKPTEYVVLNLRTGQATRYEVEGPGFFGFHHTNCWVQTDQQGRRWIMADVVTEPDASIFHSLSYEAFQNGSAVDRMGIDGTLQRLRIPLDAASLQPSTKNAGMSMVDGQRQLEWVASEKATLKPLSATMLEAPRINDAHYWDPDYQFVYGWHATRRGNHPNSLAKVRVADGSALLWTEKDDAYGVMMGEAVFVPAPGSAAEDDGVLLSAGLHIRSKRAFVLVLNATTMTELARAYASTHITFGFHSVFLPASPA